MKNWTLVMLGMLASGSLLVGSTACSSTSSGTDGTAGYGGSDAAGAGGTAAAGAGGTAAAGAGGTAAAGAGGGGSDVTSVFAAGSCQTCLQTNLKSTLPAMPNLNIPNPIDCTKVVAGCGATNDKCKVATDCVAAAQPKNPSNLDCAVESCALNLTTAEPNEFFACLANDCATECGATKGFMNTAMCMQLSARERRYRSHDEGRSASAGRPSSFLSRPARPNRESHAAATY